MVSSVLKTGIPGEFMVHWHYFLPVAEQKRREEGVFIYGCACGKEKEITINEKTSIYFYMALSLVVRKDENLHPMNFRQLLAQ